MVINIIEFSYQDCGISLPAVCCFLSVGIEEVVLGVSEEWDLQAECLPWEMAEEVSVKGPLW